MLVLGVQDLRGSGVELSLCVSSTRSSTIVDKNSVRRVLPRLLGGTALRLLMPFTSIQLHAVVFGPLLDPCDDVVHLKLPTVASFGFRV